MWILYVDYMCNLVYTHKEKFAKLWCRIVPVLILFGASRELCSYIVSFSCPDIKNLFRAQLSYAWNLLVNPTNKSLITNNCKFFLA